MEGEAARKGGEFRYLGYIIKRNGDQKEDVRDRVKKAATIMGQVWGIGKRRFRRDWGRKVWLFDKLVWTILGYGVEVLGWEEREEVEKLEEMYLR